MFELFEELERDPEPVYWRHGRSLPYGEGVTFWALGEIVKAHAGILESDTPEEAEGKLRTTVSAVIADPEEASWVERQLRPLAGAESGDGLGAGDRRSEASAAWRRFLEAVAEQRPLVLVFEDLHWADDALLDFVAHLLDWASGVPAVRQRREQDGGGVDLAATPARAARQQLRACAGQHQQGDPLGPVEQVVDEVEQVVVGPVQILEGEHERAAARRPPR